MRGVVLLLATIGFATSVFAQTGTPIPSGTWTMVLTKGLPAQTNGWEQLVYAQAVKQSIMLSLYHQRNSEPNESLVGYDFDTNSWDVLDMGGNFHTENMPEGGESQGYFGYNPNNETLFYHCCTTGSNQSENVNHDWWYDLLGQTGLDKQTSPKPPAVALQPGGAFDVAHNLFVMHGGASFEGTWTYDPVANAWKPVVTNGTPPDPSLILPALAYSNSAQKVYLFGGLSGSTYFSDLYVFDASTNTWTLINPSGGIKPPGRYRHAMAYDSTNNVFLMYGGQNASGVLNDTWIYDPSLNTWTQVTPQQSPPVTGAGIFGRLSYDRDHNVFVLAQRGSGGYFGGNWTSYAIQTWLFRYAGGGPNAGTLSPSSRPSGGGINRNTSSWAKDPAIAASGNSLYLTWSETGPPFDPTYSAWPHIYADQWGSGGWTPLGSSFFSAALAEAHAPSMSVIGSTLWASWYESTNNGPETAQVIAKSWNGSNWQGGPVGLVGSPAFQGRSQLTDVGGVAYVALIEVNKSYFPQRAFAYVKQWNGTSWSLEGAGPLNRNNTSGTTAGSISIASDGVYPYVAWTEYVRSSTTGNVPEDVDSNPQVYVSTWNDSTWAPLGGTLNVNPANSAYDASVAYLAGQLYVAWTERSQTGNAQLFVKTWNGTSWTLVGSGSLNQNPASGWAFHPSFAADAVSGMLYLGWIEQSALGQLSQVHVAQYDGKSWTTLGPSINAAPSLGSAQRVSLAILNDQPVAAWGEVNFGSLRQVYVAQWNGSNWVQLAGSGGPPDATPPTVPAQLTATAAAANQVNLAWLPSTDLVGVTGYIVYRGGVQIATVTSSLSYQDVNPSASSSTYTVAAFDAAGNISAQSAPARVGGSSTSTLSGIWIAPSSVVGGATVAGNNKVTLSGPAPSGGAIVGLTSSNSGVIVPASVTVPAGATSSAAFSITTPPVSTTTTVTISATYNGITKSGTLTVTPVALATVTIAPPSVVGGAAVTGSNKVTLNGPAPTGGAVVSLTTSDPGVTAPTSVTVPAGATSSATFSITTSAVSTTTIVTISASYNGVTKTGTLTVTPLSLSSVYIAPLSVVGGVAVAGNNKVILNGPAPSGGAVVSLSSNNSGVTVPASITILAGASSSAAFNITTSPVTTTTTVTISANYNGTTKNGTLTVTPVALQNIYISPSSVVGGATVAGNNKVVLNGPGPPGGAVVSLTSNNSGVKVPTSVTVVAGASSSAAFNITTSPVASMVTVTISANYNGVTKTGVLTVTP